MTAQTGRQHAREMAQDVIADGMAMLVIDALEAVDVNHQYAQVPAVARRLPLCGLGVSEHGAPIGQAGQFVGRGQRLQRARQ